MSVELSVKIYSITDTFPKKEMFSLTDQLRRAAVSIPSNIAEGSKRSSDKDFKHFIHISLGSCAEVQTQLFIALKLEYLTEKDFNELYNNIEDINSMLLAFIKKLSSV